MPTIDNTIHSALGGLTTTWTPLDGGDDGEAVATDGARLCVQVSGTFGTSTVTLQGSNDEVIWTDLNDEAVPANPCSFTANGLKGILQAPKFVRPIVSAGTGSDLTVVLFNTK